jgi:hypothetical protein
MTKPKREVFSSRRSSAHHERLECGCVKSSVNLGVPWLVGCRSSKATNRNEERLGRGEGRRKCRETRTTSRCDGAVASV